MATRSIAPRATGEGGIGTSAKRWALGWINALVVATLGVTGGQIAFPATQNASTDANTLDDYEEGAWTPTLGGFSVAPTVSVARYTKVGGLVAVLLAMGAGTSNANTFTITLPFASAYTVYGAAMVQAQDNGVFNVSTVYLTAASATADLYYTLSGGGLVWTTSGNKSFIGGFSYFTA